jgi:hypothetical protein
MASKEVFERGVPHGRPGCIGGPFQGQPVTCSSFIGEHGAMRSSRASMTLLHQARGAIGLRHALPMVVHRFGQTSLEQRHIPQRTGW